MSQKTVLNNNYHGLVENISIAADVIERDGKKFAKVGSVVPIHCCTKEEIANHAATSHHYCGIFTDELLAPIEELVFCRLDEKKAEKVFINRMKRLLIVSHDGVLAQWRSAATFESENLYVAGTPVVTRDAALVSVVTARRGNHYAVSSFEGDGGYFETTQPWKEIQLKDGESLYGDKTFKDLTSLRTYIKSLPPGATAPFTPVIARDTRGRVVITLVAANGRQVAHYYIHNVLGDNVEYV